MWNNKEHNTDLNLLFSKESCAYDVYKQRDFKAQKGH